MSDILDVIDAPCGAFLLVRRDVLPDRAGDLHIPDSALRNMRSTSGTVLAAGPQCLEDLAPGARIVFGEFSGTQVALEGVDAASDVLFLPDQDVLATLEGRPVVQEGFGLPVELAAVARARPGRLLVERAEMPLTRGRIVLPVGISTTTRCAEAVVRSVGAGVNGFAVGDAVLLTGNPGRLMSFGPRGERRLFQVAPSAVLGKLKAPSEEPITTDQPGFTMGGQVLEEALGPAGAVHEEGDSRGLR